MAAVTSSSADFLPGANLGPLITAFTAPLSCSMLFNTGLGSRCYDGVETPSFQSSNDDTRCWPLATVTVPTGAALSGFGFYSPGLQCPSGYTTACYDQAVGSAPAFNFNFPPAADVQESVAGCCPTGYACTLSYGNQACHSHGLTTNRVGPCIGSSLNVTATTPYSGDVYAPLIQLNWQRSDTATATATTSEAPSSQSIPAAASKKSPVSSIVGGVIGGVGGLAILVGAVYFVLIQRRKRQREAQITAELQLAARNQWCGTNRIKAELPGEGYHQELPAEREPAEMVGSGEIAYELPVPGRDVPMRKK